jgi:hypothetical protein
MSLLLPCAPAVVGMLLLLASLEFLMYSVLTVAGLPNIAGKRRVCAVRGRAREAKTLQYLHNFTHTVYAKICMQEGTDSKCHSDGKIVKYNLMQQSLPIWKKGQ